MRRSVIASNKRFFLRRVSHPLLAAIDRFEGRAFFARAFFAGFAARFGDLPFFATTERFETRAFFADFFFTGFATRFGDLRFFARFETLLLRLDGGSGICRRPQSVQYSTRRQASLQLDT